MILLFFLETTKKEESLIYLSNNTSKGIELLKSFTTLHQISDFINTEIYG